MFHHSHYCFECNDCGSVYPGDQFIYLCPECEKQNDYGKPMKGVLKMVYDYTAIKQKFHSKLPNHLTRTRYLDLLPIHSFKFWPNLRVGNTPLYHEHQDDNSTELFIKDDSQNPTFSFKDRASALVSAFAREHGINSIAAASTGNAGSSLAGICASNRQKSIIYVPKSAPVAKLVQIISYGAKIITVDGNYDAAFDMSLEATRETGIFNRNTAFNPLTIEGKKTAAFEMYEQLNGKAPDFLFVPVGDGVIISGIYKGFEDLLKLGLIQRIPVIVAVQAEGSANLVNNMNSDTFFAEPSHTLADSISVDIPRNFFMARDYLKQYQGSGLLVSDSEIIDASGKLASQYGLFTEPASAAAYAGYLKFNKIHSFPPFSAVVVQLTGSGLKDVNTVLKNDVRFKEIVKL